MSWESWWVVHVLVAMILFPMIWAIVAIPDLFEIISNSPNDAIYLAMLFGSYGELVVLCLELVFPILDYH